MTGRTIAVFVLTSCFCLPLAGCEPPIDGAGITVNAPPGPPPPPAVRLDAPVSEGPSSGTEAKAADATNLATPSGESSPTPEYPLPSPEQPQPAPVSAPLSPANAAQQTAIQLSAGVAVPQLLPEGTQIGVSVDYRVTGRLKTSSRYLLVIESSAGEIAFPVELSNSGGTLQGFCPLSVRPEHKPFSARIDEQVSESSRRKVSNTLNLATSY